MGPEKWIGTLGSASQVGEADREMLLPDMASMGPVRGIFRRCCWAMKIIRIF